MKRTVLLTAAFILILTGCAGTGTDNETASVPTEAAKTGVTEDALQEPAAGPGRTPDPADASDGSLAAGEPGGEGDILPPDYGSLAEAPALTVSTQNDADRITASCGNSQWSCILPDGTATSLVACGAHPLDLQDHPILYTAFPAGSLPAPEDGTSTGAMSPVFRLDFGEIPPETVSAVRWPASFIGNAQNHTEAEEVAVESGEDAIMLVPLGDGDYVYEVCARWGETGSAAYVFRTIPRTREDPEDGSADLFEALDGLEYRPYTCDGLPEYRLSADDGTAYAVNFTEKWVWRGNSEQADLPDGLAAMLKGYQGLIGTEVP